MRVGHVSSLVVQKLETMAFDGDLDELRSKRKAIMTLLLYAIRQERDGQPEMFSIFLRAAKASEMLDFGWHHVDEFVPHLYYNASPCAVVLASPHTPWHSFIEDLYLIERWTEAVSLVPYTEEIAQSVVNKLLRIASSGTISEYIPAEVWLWLKRRPKLPPTCWGHHFGTSSQVVKVVRGLKDVEVLKSYLLLIWSEWSTSWDELGF